MSSIQLIQQAICYMEEHIYENINYADVAKNIHMSSYNFHRTFSFIAGMTANEYIRNRRLTLAAQEFQTTDLSVLDAAYKYGYESPESFSKAFSRFHGSTPKQAKQKGAKLHLFNPLVIKITLEGGSIMDYRIEHRERHQFLALVRAFPNEISTDHKDHSIPGFWSECSEKNLIEPLKSLCAEGKSNLYGLCSADIPYGKPLLPTMPYLNALAPMVIVWLKHGANFSRNLPRRQAMCKPTIPTMKYILKTVKAVCSASYGFRLSNIEFPFTGHFMQPMQFIGCIKFYGQNPAFLWETLRSAGLIMPYPEFPKQKCRYEKQTGQQRQEHIQNRLPPPQKI